MPKCTIVHYLHSSIHHIDSFKIYSCQAISPHSRCASPACHKLNDSVLNAICALNNLLMYLERPFSLSFLPGIRETAMFVRVFYLFFTCIANKLIKCQCCRMAAPLIGILSIIFIYWTEMGSNINFRVFKSRTKHTISYCFRCLKLEDIYWHSTEQKIYIECCIWRATHCCWFLNNADAWKHPDHKIRAHTFFYYFSTAPVFFYGIFETQIYSKTKMK